MFLYEYKYIDRFSNPHECTFKLLSEFKMHFSWEALIHYDRYVTLKRKLVANERNWWLCLISFLKLWHRLLISNGIGYSQYAPKFDFLARMDLEVTCKDFSLCLISIVVNFWSLELEVTCEDFSLCLICV